MFWRVLFDGWSISLHTNWPIWAEIVGGDSTLYLRKDLLKHSTSFGNDLVLCLNEKYIWSQLLRILGIICGNLDKVCDSNKPKKMVETS